MKKECKLRDRNHGTFDNLRCLVANPAGLSFVHQVYENERRGEYFYRRSFRSQENECQSWLLVLLSFLGEIENTIRILHVLSQYRNIRKDKAKSLAYIMIMLGSHKMVIHHRRHHFGAQLIP